MISRDVAEAFAAEWIEAWNAHDLERILEHYAEEIEFASPFIATRFGEPSGVLKGKAAVRAYWADGLARQPGLRFRLRDTYVGVNGVVLHYDRHDGRIGAEHFEFGPDGRVVRAAAHYSEATGRAGM